MRQTLQALLSSLLGQNRAIPLYLLSPSCATLTWRLGEQWGQVQVGLKAALSSEGRWAMVEA
jgi:hypothetical protein